MQEIATAHCRDNYLREFAFKTIAGIDKPNKTGGLPDARRLRLTPIKNSKQLNYTIQKYTSRPGEYITVYAFERLVKAGDTKINGTAYPEYQIGKGVYYESAKINRIYLDFDAEGNPKLALSEALLVARELFKRGIVVHSYFSGKKGIAMYIEFAVLDLKEQHKQAILVEFFNTIKEMIAGQYENFNGMTYPLTAPVWSYELITLDTTIKGDIARVSRIPNTRHKSGLYCIPLTYGEMYQGIEHIKALAQSPRFNIDLEDTITKNIIRNTPIMHTILKNIEKQIIADKVYKSTMQQIKKQSEARIKNKIGYSKIRTINLDRLKEIPLSKIIFSTITNDRTRCELHGGDNITSLQIYPHTNSFYCHVCKKGGSVIDYVMARDRADVRTAIATLIEVA